MAKLYFRYGAMGSAKTLNLLAVAHNYESQQKRPLVFKVAIDNRWNSATVRSRAGLEREPDSLLEPTTQLRPEIFVGVDCVLVDEAQFLSSAMVEQLRSVATDLDVPVICYGLRADFRNNLFEGSKRLFELADTIEEIKTTCHYCNRKATMNLKHSDGIANLDGPSVRIGAEETFLPACFHCYRQKLRDGGFEVCPPLDTGNKSVTEKM